MKLRATIVTIGLLIGAAVFAQDKPKGYDIGVCGSDYYLPVHAAADGKDLKVDFVSPAPGEVTKVTDPTVYKYQKDDEKGAHYVTVIKQDDGKDIKFELVIDYKKGTGLLYADGVPEAVLFLEEDADGSKLADLAMKMFGACVDLHDQDQGPRSKA